MFAKVDVNNLKHKNLPVDYNKLTWTERIQVRNQYLNLQCNKCYFCHNNIDHEPTQDVLNIKINPELYPEGFFKNKTHLHHHHDTGMTIGTVHAYCNAILWEYYNE